MQSSRLWIVLNSCTILTKKYAISVYAFCWAGHVRRPPENGINFQLCLSRTILSGLNSDASSPQMSLSLCIQPYISSIWSPGCSRIGSFPDFPPPRGRIQVDKHVLHARSTGWISRSAMHVLAKYPNMYFGTSNQLTFVNHSLHIFQRFEKLKSQFLLGYDSSNFFSQFLPTLRTSSKKKKHARSYRSHWISRGKENIH